MNSESDSCHEGVKDEVKLLYLIFQADNDQYQLVFFCSTRYVLNQIDICIQFGEDADVKVKDFDPPEDD